MNPPPSSAARPIDVRSDTVTRPDAAMRRAMHDAEVGDDVYGDDPTVNRLEAVAAERLGHEAALFLPTGTQSNLVALLTHCGRGDEYVVGHDAHTYKYEGGGAAALGGIQPQTVPFDERGGLAVEAVAAVVKEDDPHFARTRLVCLENSQHGRVQDLESLRAMRRFATGRGLALHLDGARMANACVALGIDLEPMGREFDSVSLCLSKGLGAPVGSVLAGGRGFVDEARRWRKVTGGGMRQAGILAAAGLIALDDGFARLHEDHENAARLADALSDVDGLAVRKGWTQTNMVWLDVDDPAVGAALGAFARERGVLLSSGRGHVRLVTHKDVSPADLGRVVDVIREHVEASTMARGGPVAGTSARSADAHASRRSDGAAAPLS